MRGPGHSEKRTGRDARLHPCPSFFRESFFLPRKIFQKFFWKFKTLRGQQVSNRAEGENSPEKKER